MTDREVMQQALEALCSAVEPKNGKVYARGFEPIDCYAMHEQAIAAIRTALEQQAEPVCPECKAAVLYECVACSSNNYPPPQQADPPPPEWPLIKNIIAEYGLDAISFVAEWKAAQRRWQGLTEQDMPSGEDPMFDHLYFIAGMVYADKVLKKKNT